MADYNIAAALEDITRGFEFLGLNPVRSDQWLGRPSLYMLRRPKKKSDDLDGDAWLRLSVERKSTMVDYVCRVDFKVGPSFWMEIALPVPSMDGDGSDG